LSPFAEKFMGARQKRKHRLTIMFSKLAPTYPYHLVHNNNTSLFTHTENLHVIMHSRRTQSSHTPKTKRRTHTQAHLRGLSRAPVIRKTRAAFCPPCGTVHHRPSDAGSHSCITVVTSVSALQNTSVIMGSAAMERSGRGRRRPAATSGQHRTGVSVDSVRELRHGGRNPHAGVRR